MSFFFLFFLLSVAKYLQFCSMETAQMWKAVSCANVEQKYALFFFFCLCFEHKIKKQCGQMMHNETVCRFATFRLTDVKFSFGPPAHRLQVPEGLSRLCMADDFLRRDNSQTLCERLCFKVSPLMPGVITDHNGKHNDLSSFALLFFKHCLHFPQQRKQRKLLFWYYDSFFFRP